MGDEPLYQETYRPQFHFTPKTNWTNDPNGLMYYKGEYHLFFQHNPFGINWGHMTWGHAVSPDMVHWTQLDHAIHPDELGTIFSGSGVVDWGNTAGFQTGEEAVLVCIYTSAGGTSPESEGRPFTQSIAYSNDRGRTWTQYEGNPVLGHIAGSNRDPKVIWHEPTGKWVMALFLDGHDYALFGSPDLKEWTRLSDVHVEGASECPDFFELPVDGDPASTRWVFWGASGNYLLGSFDGTSFTPEGESLRSNWGAHCYAAQTWSDIPPSDGRRLQIAWMAKGEYPGMPFNQQMSFPRELTLRTTPDRGHPRAHASLGGPAALAGREPPGGSQGRAVRDPRRDRARHGHRGGLRAPRGATPIRRRRGNALVPWQGGAARAPGRPDSPPDPARSHHHRGLRQRRAGLHAHLLPAQPR